MPEHGMAQPPDALLRELRGMIEASRGNVARAVNSELVWLYWRVGKRLREEIIGAGRAAYGEELVAVVSDRLSAAYGRGFSKRNIHYMVRFAEVFVDGEIVHAVRAQLGWTHLKQLISIEDPLKRDFYMELCRLERWSTRTLKKKMGSMLFERTAISRRSDLVVRQALEEVRENDRVSPDLVFRDPYVLDFLGLPETFHESDLEAAILREMESFLLELGDGFAFVARQKRMQIGPDDFHLDLLFFHRRLRCLVAIELKLDRFDARDKGQMELYLRWLDRYERQPGERPPLGLILCARGSDEQVELLELSDGSIRVARYLTELPDRHLLERKLVQSVALARARVAAGGEE